MKTNLKLVLPVLLLAFLAAGIAAAQDAGPLLAQSPSLSATQIAFAYGGQIWTVGREGGDARRLVAGSGRAGLPIFSPDGAWLAYTADYDGNSDVYVIPAGGGEPRRLTYHPGSDTALGWTPDGRQVAFRSSRNSTTGTEQMFTVPLEGGFPVEVPLPSVERASYSPDGTHLAYEPYSQWQPAWKGYRGGQTRRIWIADLADSGIVKVPQAANSNDGNPMWVGGKVYFLSDRNGPFSLFAYDIASRRTDEVLKNDGLDFVSAAAGPGAIVIEQFGSLLLHDLASGTDRPVPVRIAADMAEVRPHFEKIDAAKDVLNYGLSPTGQRAVFEAHGEIFTVPAEKGDIRDLTRTPAVAERDPAWSPDGKSIAYFSDESGEYALHVRAQEGLGEVNKIGLGEPPSFFYTPVWSPDGKKIAFSDKRLNLWVLDLDRPAPVKVDTDRLARQFDVQWSPDSRWLTYTKYLPNQLRAVFVYSLAAGKAAQITDGMSDARYPVFDRSGKYLFFSASTDMGLTEKGINMSGLGHPITRAVYAVVLKKDLPSPIPPQSDEEKDEKADKKDGDTGKAAPAGDKKDKDKDKGKDKGGEKGKDEEAEKPAPVEMDFEGLGQRIVALPVPAKNYYGLWAGKEGQLYLAEGPVVNPIDDPPKMTVSKFDLESRKTEPLLSGVSAFALAAKGEKMLFRTDDQWTIAAADKAPEAGKGALATKDWRVYVDPRAEWRQMYREVWRIERDFFYDPNHHGLDLAAAEKAYAQYLDGIAGREDLNVLFSEMTGNLTVGHLWAWGGTRPKVEEVKVGLLGADFAIDAGRYRFARVYDGENWNPDLQAPLTQPGVNVRAGEVLLAVNGRDLTAGDNLYSFFQATAGRQTVLRVGPSPDGKDAREVTVVPVASERNLRHLAWIEGNRRKVDALSGGRVAYVHLPDTAGAGYTSFNRYFFAQVEKQAAVLDERFNGGGYLADYIIDYLQRPPMSRVMFREGEDFTEPAGAIFGPKVMIINQFAGSGGDAMPWYFRKAGIGPLVGMRTWGGLVGIAGFPVLMDGGGVTAPNMALYGLEGEWEVENTGIAPDIEVEQDPKLVREGRDPQLEMAVQLALEMLAKNPPPAYKRPAYPVYKHPLPPLPGKKE